MKTKPINLPCSTNEDILYRMRQREKVNNKKEKRRGGVYWTISSILTNTMKLSNVVQ
jgi:hypothetical protein